MYIRRKVYSQYEDNFDDYGYDYSYNDNMDERLYSTGDCELDDLLERAFSEGYTYAQKVFHMYKGVNFDNSDLKQFGYEEGKAGSTAKAMKKMKEAIDKGKYGDMRAIEEQRAVHKAKVETANQLADRANTAFNMSNKAQLKDLQNQLMKETDKTKKEALKRQINKIQKSGPITRGNLYGIDNHLSGLTDKEHKEFDKDIDKILKGADKRAEKAGKAAGKAYETSSWDTGKFGGIEADRRAQEDIKKMNSWSNRLKNKWNGLGKWGKAGVAAGGAAALAGGAYGAYKAMED